MTTFAEELNNLGSALLTSAQRLAEHIGASDYAKYSRIGSEMHNLASSYAHGVMNLMEHGGSPKEFQQFKDVAADVMQSIDNMRDNASHNYEKAGKAIAKAESISKFAGNVGAVASIAQLGLAMKEAADTGNYDNLGKVGSEILGGLGVAAVAAALVPPTASAAVVVAAGAFATYAGIKLGGWVWKHLFEPLQDWLSYKFDDWFGLNRDGNYFLYDPLVLDLDGDGVELIAENDWNGVLFDFNGNGIKTATQWVKSDDGLLVFDRNDNGKIDNGSELFGEDTPIRFITDPVYDGFSALQTIDTHPDFEINAKKFLKYQSTIAINDSILIFQAA